MSMFFDRWKEEDYYEKEIGESMNLEAEDMIVKMWHKYNVPVKVKKLDPRATIPKYQREGDAGFDFHALLEKGLEYVKVDPNQQKIICTGISCTIPVGYEIQVRPRSGLAFKSEITITNSPGTVDSGYVIPNEIKIIIKNLSPDKTFIIKSGDRIAQGVLSIVPMAIFEEVVEEEDSNRNRGGGFGSTDLK